MRKEEPVGDNIFVKHCTSQIQEDYILALLNNYWVGVKEI
jgi:hypothetical protein